MFNKVTPFIVALFVGDKKPYNNGDFLHDFLHEYELLMENGFQQNKKVLNIKISAFVCDTPARQFLKGIKGHSSYYGCKHCEVEGTYEHSRMLFHDIAFLEMMLHSKMICIWVLIKVKDQYYLKKELNVLQSFH